MDREWARPGDNDTTWYAATDKEVEASKQSDWSISRGPDTNRHLCHSHSLDVERGEESGGSACGRVSQGRKTIPT